MINFIIQIISIILFLLIILYVNKKYIKIKKDKLILLLVIILTFFIFQKYVIEDELKESFETTNNEPEIQIEEEIITEPNDQDVIIEKPRSTDNIRDLVRQAVPIDRPLPNSERKISFLSNDIEAVELNKDPLNTNSIGEIGPILREVEQTSQKQISVESDKYTLINPKFWSNTTISDFEKKESCMCPVINMKNEYLEL